MLINTKYQHLMSKAFKEQIIKDCEYSTGVQNNHLPKSYNNCCWTSDYNCVYVV